MGTEKKIEITDIEVLDFNIKRLKRCLMEKMSERLRRMLEAAVIDIKCVKKILEDA